MLLCSMLCLFNEDSFLCNIVMTVLSYVFPHSMLYVFFLCLYVGLKSFTPNSITKCWKYDYVAPQNDLTVVPTHPLTPSTPFMLNNIN